MLPYEFSIGVADVVQTDNAVPSIGIDAYGVDIDPEPISNGIARHVPELGFEPQKAPAFVSTLTAKSHLTGRLLPYHFLRHGLEAIVSDSPALLSELFSCYLPRWSSPAFLPQPILHCWNLISYSVCSLVAKE